MPTCHVDLATKMGISLATALVLATGSVHAQGPVSRGADTFRPRERPTLSYWTPERMRTAVAKPFPRAVAKAGSETQSIEAFALDPTAAPGFAPGWQPGRTPQPTAEAHFEIALDDPQYQQMLSFNLPQTTPPFVPPSTPKDFANYAPFQRCTWQQ